jgi:hypothetical protein
VLRNGESWQSGAGRLQVTFDNSLSGRELRAKFVYTNTGSSELDFIPRPEDFRMFDDEGALWSLGGSDFSKRSILKPGEKFEFGTYFVAPAVSDRRVTFVVERFGDVRGATWAFTLRGGQIKPVSPPSVPPGAATATASTAAAVTITTPEATLRNGESWQSGAGRLQVTFANGLSGRELRARYVYTNTSASEVDFVLKPEDFRMFDDQGGVWTLGGTDFARRYILAPGDRIEFDTYFIAPGTSDRKVTFVVDRFGDIQEASWAFTLRGGQVIR